MVHSSLTTRFATTTDYSSRNGVRVDAIGHHHAASTSLEGTLLQFQPGGRQVSPNYCIEGRNIVLVVPEEFRPWTSASSVDDARSITYEIINSSGDPDWRFSAATIESVVALDIDICRRYGITPKWGMPGLWQHKDLYIWFGRSYPTACAGPSFPKDHIVSAVSAGLAGTTPPPTTSYPNGGNNMYFLRTVDGTVHFVTEAGFEPVRGIAHLNLLQRFVKAFPSFDTFNEVERDTIFGYIAAARDITDEQYKAIVAGLNNVKVSVDSVAIGQAVSAEVVKYLAEHGVEVDATEIAAAVDEVLKDDFAAIPGAVIHEIAS